MATIDAFTSASEILERGIVGNCLVEQGFQVVSASNSATLAKNERLEELFNRLLEAKASQARIMVT